MVDRRVTLPDLDGIDAASIAGYTADPTRMLLRLWIDALVDAEGPVRVFTSEAPDVVHVLVVPTPPRYPQAYAADWPARSIRTNVADVGVRLEAPLGERRLVNAKDGSVLSPLPAWILAEQATHPAPRERPIGPLSENDPLTFRGEL